MKNLVRFQILALLPLLVVVTLGFYFKHLVMFAINTNFALNAIILGVMLIGVVIMHQLIWSIRAQSRKAGEFVTRVRMGDEMRVVLQDPEMSASDIGLVCDHLVHSHDGVSGSPVDVVEAGLSSLHVTLNSRQELAQFLIGFLVALGLMGTFIGILETLVEIGNMIGGFATSDMQDIDKSFMGLISDLTKPLQGMGTAFSASMFGLLGSICLGLTMISVRRCTEEFLTGLRHAINQLIKDRRSAQSDALPLGVIPKRAMDANLPQRDNSALLERGLEAQAQVIQKLAELEQHFGELRAMMGKQVEEVAETNDLLRANSVSRETTEQFMGHVKVLATSATENSTNLSALLPALSGVAQNLSGFSNTLLQQRDYVQKTMLSSAESQGMIRNALVSLVEKENDIRAGMLNEMTQLRKFMLEMQPLSSQMVPLLSEISSRVNEQSVSASSQQESLNLMTQSVTQTFGGIKSGMNEMLQESERSRQLQSEISMKLVDSQRTVADVGKMQQSTDKIAEILANSVAANQALIQEIRDMRKSMAGEVRSGMLDALRQDSKDRALASSSLNKSEDSGKTKP